MAKVESNTTLILLANSTSCCSLPHEGLKSRWPRLSWALARNPYAHADKVHRCSRQDMLQMGFGCAHIAGPSDAKGAHGLGNGSFNASALGVVGCIGGRPFPLSGGS